jgi:hypothetical protein
MKLAKNTTPHSGPVAHLSEIECRQPLTLAATANSHHLTMPRGHPSFQQALQQAINSVVGVTHNHDGATVGLAACR